MKVTEQRTFSFRPDATARYQSGNFPALMWFRSGANDRCITTFPQSQDGAVSFFVEGIDAASDVGETGGHFFERDIRPFFNCITPQIVGSDLCYYTLTPDGGFIIDRPPENDRILVISACSGHGFKHSLAVGELAAQMLLGEGTTCVATSFAVGRFCA